MKKSGSTKCLLPPRVRYWRKARAARKDQLEAFEALAAELGHSPGALALSWLLHQEGVTSTILGPASLEQLEGVLGVPEIALSEASLARLDELFPPVGAAPEAYAW